MRYLLLIGSLMLAVLTLGAPLALATHVVLAAPAAALLWLTATTTRPLRPCTRCDKGQNWDSAGQNFGEVCPGWFSIPFTEIAVGGCGASGKVLRPGARFLRAVGAGRTLRNLPPEMRSRDER